MFSDILNPMPWYTQHILISLNILEKIVQRSEDFLCINILSVEDKSYHCERKTQSDRERNKEQSVFICNWGVRVVCEKRQCVSIIGPFTGWWASCPSWQRRQGPGAWTPLLDTWGNTNINTSNWFIVKWTHCRNLQSDVCLNCTLTHVHISRVKD